MAKLNMGEVDEPTMQLVREITMLDMQLNQKRQELGVRLGIVGMGLPPASAYWRANSKNDKPKPAPSSPAPKKPKKSGTPISELVSAILAKGPATFEGLWKNLGAANKKAIRSTLDKRKAAGVYDSDKDGRWFLKPAKPEKAKKVNKPKPAAPPAGVTIRRVDAKKPPPASTVGAEQIALPGVSTSAS